MLNANWQLWGNEISFLISQLKKTNSQRQQVRQVQQPIMQPAQEK